MTTVTQAKDDLAQLFSDAWLADPLSENIIVFYDKSSESEGQKDASKSWVRFTIKHLDGGFSKASLSGSGGERIYHRDGVVHINIFTPVQKSINTDSALTSIVLNAFEGKATPGGVWVRSVSFAEAGVSGAWFQTNIKAKFNYSECK